MKPVGTTTTTTEIWQWHCAACRADWKMMRQVTTTSCCLHGHGCRCCQGTPLPPGGNPPLPPPHHHQVHHHNNHHHHHHHHHRHRHAEGTSSRALAADDGPNNAVLAGRDRNTTALKPAPAAVAQVCWAPDPYLMAQQLREFESLDVEVVALRVQLQEYAEEIERSVAMRDKQDDGTNDWFVALPANVRDVLVMARDAIESLIAITAATAPAN